LIVGYGNFYADLGGVIKHGSGLAMGDEMPEAKQRYHLALAAMLSFNVVPEGTQ
jgi:hypothetical protein